MNRKLAGFAAVTAVIALAGVAGCSSAGKEGATSGGGGGSASSISMWTHNAGNEDEMAVVNQVISDWNADHNAQVTMEAFLRPLTMTQSSLRLRLMTCPVSWTSTLRSCRTGPGLDTSLHLMFLLTSSRACPFDGTHLSQESVKTKALFPRERGCFPVTDMQATRGRDA